MKNNFKPYIVAVYGTLRKGSGNHRLLEDCKFVGEAKTNDKFTMYSHGGFPSIAKGGPKDTNIKVELYEVSNQRTSDSLDMLEGYPGWYDKKKINIDDKEVYIYTMQESIKSNRPVIESGDWIEYVKY